jgi:outer membrane protein assembly factor BamB
VAKSARASAVEIAMKSRPIILGIAAVAVAMAVVNPPALRHLPVLGPRTPIKKWEFIVADSIVQDCAKPHSLLYNFSTHKCDPRIPDSLPEHSPAVDVDGTIYAGGAKGLYALNPDGTEKWFYKLQENGFDFQTGYRPVLYTFLDDNNHVWLDFKSRYETQTAGLCRVDAGGDGKCLVSGIISVTQAGLLKDGTIFILWDNTPPTFLNPDGSPQANAGYIPNGNIRQEWWDAEFGIPRTCRPPAFGADGLRYVGCKDELVVLRSNGSKQWSFSMAGHWASQPAIAEDGTVYVGSADSHLYALSADGQLKWKFATGDAVLSTPAIARNGTIFFGSNDHYLYALGPDGKRKWEFQTGGQVFSPTLGPDGTIYALSADGKLYAIQDTEQNGGLWGQWPKWAGGVRNNWRGSVANESSDTAEAPAQAPADY